MVLHTYHLANICEAENQTLFQHFWVFGIKTVTAFLGTPAFRQGPPQFGCIPTINLQTDSKTRLHQSTLPLQLPPPPLR